MFQCDYKCFKCFIAHLGRKFKRKLYARYKKYRRQKHRSKPKNLNLINQRNRRNRQKNELHSIIVEEREMMERTILPSLTIINNTGSNNAPIEDPYEHHLKPTIIESKISNTSLMVNTNLLPIPLMDGGPNSPRNRRSSVMFNDVVQMHGGEGDTRNVCLSEKQTQTDPEPLENFPTLDNLKPMRFVSNP